jgi:hypothetical protein
MNISQVVKEYVLRMINDVSGMKVMLFDRETVRLLFVFQLTFNSFRTGKNPPTLYMYHIPMHLYMQAGIVSMVLSQSDILEKDVFLTEYIDVEKRERMVHLKAIVFVRPTKQNIDLLCKELKKPHYGEYYLCKSQHFNSCTEWQKKIVSLFVIDLICPEFLLSV